MIVSIQIEILWREWKKLIDFNRKGMNLRRKRLGFGWEIKNRKYGRKWTMRRD